MSHEGIRPGEPRDHPALLDIWYRASRLAHPFLDEGFLAEERLEIEQHWLPAAETWVYEADGAVLGYVALLENLVGALFVDPDHHRTGIGRRLMDHAVRLRGALEVEVFEANRIGRAFYAAYGFEPAGASIHEPTGHRLLRWRFEPSDE